MILPAHRAARPVLSDSAVYETTARNQLISSDAKQPPPTGCSFTLLAHSPLDSRLLSLLSPSFRYAFLPVRPSIRLKNPAGSRPPACKLFREAAAAA